MFPIDQRVAGHLQDSSTQTNRFFKNGSKSVEYIADPGAVIIGVSLYGVGRLAHWKPVADLGLHGTEAVAVSGALTTLLKGVAGRAGRRSLEPITERHDSIPAGRVHPSAHNLMEG
jgi:hypothetical protein